ncbi:hypothetical protein NIES4071_85780 [Calothrix sp. NIES-4071]|nr:hypothetical protein NIES4071_85780 [Calothrix sp. NIES-4071]BAZ62845.1 hypothetical protein NIES4105_85710 [Calothrix sp. NIES-4105]
MNTISIWIEYKLVNNPDSLKIEIAPEDYFEPLDEDEDPDFNNADEEYDYDSVPKYFHAIEYIGCEISDVEHTKVTILDERNSIEYIQSETFWNKGEDRMIMTQTLGKEVNRYDMLLETLINIKPKTIQQVKFIIENNVPKYQEQIIIQTNEDGSESILLENVQKQESNNRLSKLGVSV